MNNHHPMIRVGGTGAGRVGPHPVLPPFRVSPSLVDGGRAGDEKSARKAVSGRDAKCSKLEGERGEGEGESVGVGGW